MEKRELAIPDASAEQLLQTLMAADTSPSGHLMRQERHERLESALASLSTRPRGRRDAAPRAAQAPAEIAAMLEISEAAVKSRLLRALIRLKDQMVRST